MNLNRVRTLCGLCVSALLFFLPGESALGQKAPPDSTFVVLLGTGNPYPDPNAQGPATAVVLGTRVFLIDAGPGVMRQMRAANLTIRGPEAVFFTHLHSDHTLGYPDLIFTSWVMGRTAPLESYGPPGLRAMTDHLTAAYAEDIQVREQGLEHQTPGAWKVNVHEIKPGVIYKKDGITVTAISVPHGSWKTAFGYRIDTPDRSVVISGDTRPSKELEKAAKGVDVLVHEVYPEAKIKPEERLGGSDWPKYMRSFHTSDKELGALAARSGPRLLILYHIVRMGGTDDELLAGVRTGGFKGRVVVGKDLGKY